MSKKTTGIILIVIGGIVELANINTLANPDNEAHLHPGDTSYLTGYYGALAVIALLGAYLLWRGIRLLKSADKKSEQ